MARNNAELRGRRNWPSILIITGFTLLIGFFLSSVAEEYTRYNAHGRLKTSATSLAASFDPNQIASLSGSSFDEGTQSLDILRGQLRRIKAASPRYHSVYLLGHANDDIYFIADAQPKNSDSFSAPGEPYKEASPELRRIFKEGLSLIEGPIGDGRDARVSAHAAIRNQSGEVIAILGIDQSASEWITSITQTRYAGWIITVLLAAISSMIFSLLRQVRLANDILRESARNVETFLNATPDALIIVNDELEIIQTNDEIEEVFGYTSDNLVQKPLKDLVVPEDYDRLIDLWTEYFDTGAVNVDFSALEFSGVRSTGETFPMALRLSRFTSNDKQYSCGTFRDISERKAYDRRIDSMREEADAANKAKSHYIAGMSHELRTPLNVIIGYSELLQKMSSKLSEEKRQEYLDHVVHSGRHILDLVGKVLDIARVESGEVDIELEDVDVKPIAEKCLDMIRPLAFAADLELSIDTSGAASTMAVGNSVHLTQVLLNLLSNAVKYNETKGSIKVLIEPSRDDHLRISVADTGGGIPPDTSAHIFDSFNRLDREYVGIEGHGIGLNLAKTLVEGMGGLIGFESNDDDGSVFWIELPLATKQPGAQETHTI